MDGTPVVLRPGKLIHELFVIHGGGVFTIQSSAQRNIVLCIVRKQGVFVIQGQGIDKALLQALLKSQGAAQKSDFSLDLTSLGQTGNGLIHNGLIDAGSDIGFIGSLIQQGLYVGFGKNTAAGCDIVNLLMPGAQFVQFLQGYIQQGSHLIDEGSCAACAAAIHSLFNSSGQEKDLCVFSAQLDDSIHVFLKVFHGYLGGKNLLNKFQPGIPGQSQSGRSCDGDLQTVPFQQIIKTFENLHGIFPDLCVMPSVMLVYDIAFFIQYNDLDCGGTDVNPDEAVHLFTFSFINGLLKYSPKYSIIYCIPNFINTQTAGFV